MTAPQLPEPDDLSMAVVVEARERKVIWRDDVAAREWRGNDLHADERWWDEPDSDPMSWTAQIKYAETVHLVDPAPMRAEPTCRAVSVWGYRCHLTRMHDGEHTDGNACWTGDGQSRPTPEQNVRLLAALHASNEAMGSEADRG